LFTLQKGDTATDIRGKVILLAGRQPSFQDLNRLMQKQPAAVLFAQRDIDKQPSQRTGRMYFSLYRSRQIPTSVRISEAMAEAILQNDFAKAKEQTLETKVYNTEMMLKFEKEVQTISASNVLGVIEGTDKKDELVVISAHYDHIGVVNGKINPGADDDGSGTVGMLELAEAFAKAKAAGKGPRRSIVFLAVSGEEKGLWGSEYYSKHPVYPLEKTSIDINIDMIGRKDNNLNSADSNNHVYLIGDDKLSSELPRFVDSINKLYIKLITDRKYNDPTDPNRLYYRSDHYNFARKGVPIVFFFDVIHKYYHRPTDTPDKINYDLHEKRTRLVFLLAWEAANRNTMFVRDKPLDAVGTR
jgi:Zn-dependent M28 family amino/carboxypeptidase